MEAEIDAQGRLIIRPTTPTEAFALAAWEEQSWVRMQDIVRCEQGHWRGSRILLIKTPPVDAK